MKDEKKFVCAIEVKKKVKNREVDEEKLLSVKKKKIIKGKTKRVSAKMKRSLYVQLK